MTLLSGKGGIDDVFGTADGAVQDPDATGLIAWASGAPTLGLGSIVPSEPKGDVPNPHTFEPTAPTLGLGAIPPVGPKGPVEDPNGFVVATPTLGVGSIAPSTPKGGIQGDYSGDTLAGEYFNATWAAGGPALSEGTLIAPSGKGDVPNPWAFIQLPEPPVLVFTVSNATIHLSWTAFPPGIKYNLYRGVNGGTPTLYQAALTTTSYDDTALVRNNTYQYYVDPIVPPQGSLQSNVVSVIGLLTNLYNIPGSYTYTKPIGQYTAYELDVTVIGGGGGAGAGSATQQGFSSGGQAGAGGGIAYKLGIAPSTFTPSVIVVVGPGGLGLANGVGGQAQSGGASSFGSYFTANGGQGGFSFPESSALTNGGTASSSLAGAYTETGGKGGFGNSGYPSIPDAPATLQAPSGGGGGGAQDIGQGTRGGNGGPITTEGILAAPGGVRAFSRTTPAIAGDGTQGATASDLAGGGGGGGGSADTDIGHITAIGGRGGDGGAYGGGAGGGGRALSGTGGSPTGGAGANGYVGCVNVITWFW